MLSVGYPEFVKPGKSREARRFTIGKIIRIEIDFVVANFVLGLFPISLFEQLVDESFTLFTSNEFAVETYVLGEVIEWKADN